MSHKLLNLKLAKTHELGQNLPQDVGADNEKWMVHLGLGAFHRAHQAVYTQKANGAENTWRIIGASLKSAGTRNKLKHQDNCYTVVEKDNHSVNYRLVNVIRDVLVACEEPQKIIATMANPLCHLVTLTITEKGYCHHPSSGELNTEHPDIAHDLQYPLQPKSAVGFLVAALALRKTTGLAGLSMLSCDNLPENGHMLQKLIYQYANIIDKDLARWILVTCAFPCSMVDRIVPQTTDKDRLELSEALAYRDEAMVACEVFCQWIIEDNFAGPRPRWENVGALMVPDVLAYEKMKLRLLNGSHSMLAYLGFLAGYKTVDETMADTRFVKLLTLFMDKGIHPTITEPAGIDLDQYKQQLLQRFNNRCLQHRTEQIAMDGSQKLPQRILQPLVEQLRLDQSDLSTRVSIDVLCLTIAAWIRYTVGEQESSHLAKGQSQEGRGETVHTYPVKDPLIDKIQAIHKNAGKDAARIVNLVFSISEIFPPELINNPRVKANCAAHLSMLLDKGSIYTIEHFLEKTQ